MRHVRSWAAMLLAVVSMAACADVPTAPERGAISAENAAGPSNTVVLDPVVVIGECNPYYSANFCKGTGTCMSSDPSQPTDPESATINSCPGTGDGGGGGGWGGGDGGGGSDPRTTEPCIESGTGECPDNQLPDTWDDEIGQDTLPNCTNTATWTKAWHAPYCNGSAPTGATLTAFNAEISAMEAKGGVCAELGRFGRLLLAQGMVRYYISSGATAKSWGGAGIGIIMDDAMVSNSPPYDHGWSLAHELEHAYSGYVHPPDGSDRDANGVARTPNDSCG
jgi:hypothetical protein